MNPDQNAASAALTGTATARYDGPLALAQSLSAFALAGAAGATFTRNRLRLWSASGTRTVCWRTGPLCCSRRWGRTLARAPEH